MKKFLTGMALAAIFLSSCQNKTSVSTTGTTDSLALKSEKNKATALASEQAIGNKDIEGVVKNCAPGFVEYGNSDGKPMNNIDSIKSGLKEVLNAFPDFKGSDMKAFGSGDTVMVSATWAGTFKNALMGDKPNGKSFKFVDLDIFTFDKDGKFTSHRSIQSDATILMQLGIVALVAKK